MLLTYIEVCALGYLLGGILFSYHLPIWLKRVDVTKLGADHNPGTTNAVKYAGAPVGMLCLMADMAKGMLPVRLGMACLDMQNVFFALVMAAPVLGHATAPFYRIQGGKGIAVSFGVLMALRPVSDAIWVLSGLYILFSVALVIHPNERRTVTVFGLFAVWAMFFRLRVQTGIAVGCLLLSLIVMWKNRKAPDMEQAAQTQVLLTEQE